jgi:pyruvate,water dikinase
MTRDMEAPLIRWFAEIGIDDVAQVGGKNASLGELHRHLVPKGVRVPDGFAVTAHGYRLLLSAAGLAPSIARTLADLDTRDVECLRQRGRQVRHAIRALGSM